MRGLRGCEGVLYSLAPEKNSFFVLRRNHMDKRVAGAHALSGEKRKSRIPPSAGAGELPHTPSTPTFFR